MFFTGGDQARITRALVDPSGARTPVLAAVWRLLERGGVVAGTSAGAAVMSTTMFNEPAEIPLLLARGVERGTDIAPGLGFIGPGLFVDQHALARGRFARMLVAMRASGDTLGIGVDEDTAAIVAGDRVEVVGASGVVLVDLARARFDPKQRGLAVDGVVLGVLAPGDRLDRATRVVTVAADKRVVGDASAACGGDALAAGTLVAAMRATALGASCTVRSAVEPTIAFHFTRRPGTVFYRSADDAAVSTILDVGLDAR